MDGMVVVSYGVGTVLGLIVLGALLVLIVHDVTQKKHTVLRNFPVIGRLRFFFENLGEYFRQHFFAGDRDEMPFNRATPSILIGDGYCREPFEAKSIVNISGMSFGAICEPAVRALSRGAVQAGCWMDTGPIHGSPAAKTMHATRA